jgi:enoyl-CoA hydratase/carnithine racemase
MWKEIGDAFSKIGTIGDGCRCILMIGIGKGFCGGIDVTDEKFFSGLIGNTGNDDTSQDVARKSLAFRSQILQMQSAFTAVEECSVPVVASIQGTCIGAGIDLTCCADVRVCSPDAKFSIREVRLGLAADVGTLQRFPKLVGFGSRVRELCLTGGEFITFCSYLARSLHYTSSRTQSSNYNLADDFNADEAFRIGFVSRISTTNDSLTDTAHDVCLRIIRNSPVAATITKASLNFSRDHAVSEGLEHIALHNSTALMSEDLVKSFMMTGGTAPRFAPLCPHSRL